MISQLHIRLLFSCLLFFCLGLTAQSTQNEGAVDVVAHTNAAAELLPTNTFSSIALPEIIALPVESVPTDIRLSERKLQDPPLEVSTIAVQEEELLYLSVCSTIESGLPTTEIGYPFHAFW